MPKKQKKRAAGEKRAKRAARKEDKQRAAEEHRTSIRNAALRREIEYGAETCRRHEKRWRAMLHGIVAPELRARVECAWHAFENVVDVKDFQISLLLDELKEADDQYDQRTRAQIDNIDRLVTIYFDQVNDLWELSKSSINGLYQAGTFERNAFQAIHREHEDYLKTMLFSQGDDRKEIGKTHRGANLAMLEMEHTKADDVTSRFVSEMQARLDAMWTEVEEFAERYRADFAERRRLYAELDAQDVAVSDEIRATWRRIEASYQLIRRLKGQLDELNAEHRKAMDHIVSKGDYYDTVNKLEVRSNREQRESDQRNLTHLTRLGADVVDYLRQFERRGAQLLRIASVCRKMETLDEKTMRFPLFRADGEKRSLSAHRDDDDDEHRKLFRDLEHFWNRVAKVEVSRYQLEEQCDWYEKRNGHLRRLVLQYCEQLNCEPQIQFLQDNDFVLPKIKPPPPPARGARRERRE